MNKEKDTKEQINEYHKLLEDLKPENISLLDEFVSELLIEKLSKSWTNSKQQLKHRHKQMSLPDLITHIITEDTNKKESVVARTKVTFAKANTTQDKPFHKKYVYKIDLNNKKNYKHNNLRDALSNPIPRAFTSNSSFEKKNEPFLFVGSLDILLFNAECKYRVMKNDNPPKLKANLVEGDDIIVAVIY